MPVQPGIILSDLSDHLPTFVLIKSSCLKRKHSSITLRHNYKNLDKSTLDRRQRTNLHTFTQGPFQISSVLGLITLPTLCECKMQPFGACITEISICSFWLALLLLRDVGYAPEFWFSFLATTCIVFILCKVLKALPI